MPSIMTQVPYLPKNESQECGVGQLEPGIIHDRQKSDTKGQ